MKITCPDCSTSYEIKPQALGAEGRSVKCAKCGNRWFVSPTQEDADEAAFKADAADKKPADKKTKQDDSVKDEAEWAADAAEEENSGEPSDGGEPVDPPDTEAEADAPPPPVKKAEKKPEKKEKAAAADKNTKEAAPPADPGKADIETLAKRPKIKLNPDKFKTNRLGMLLDWIFRRNFRRIGGFVLFAGAIAFAGVLVLTRDVLVKQSPDLASLYQLVGLEVNLRGLEFRNLRTFMEVEDGKRVLVVEGSIRNLQEETNSVPAVRLSIRSADFQEVYSWTVEPRTRSLNGLDETRFRTILADPPSGASDIQVRFVDRGQRNIVLE